MKTIILIWKNLLLGNFELKIAKEFYGIKAYIICVDPSFGVLH
jgi:hypothetical protein